MSAIFVGCGAEGGTQAAQTGEACADSNALDQCPPNTQGVLEADATSNCDSSGSLDVTVDGEMMDGDGSGSISQVCVGSGSCRVVCTLIEPCTYGVQTVNDSEGVVCQAAPCGNGVCDPGENPENCNVDCGGAVCTDGASRCSSRQLQRCDRQGMWEVTPCSDGQVCVESEGRASCVESDVDCDTACDTLYTACVADSELCMTGGGGVNRNVYDGYCRERCRDYPLRFEEYLSDPDNCAETINIRVLLDPPSDDPPFCDATEPDRCPAVCQEACSTLWDDCINPEGRSENAYQCGLPTDRNQPNQDFVAQEESGFMTSCLDRCCPETGPYEMFNDSRMSPNLCPQALTNGLFECAEPQCRNGVCEYREQRDGPAECRDDCR